MSVFVSSSTDNWLCFETNDYKAHNMVHAWTACTSLLNLG